jgi:hypothetical protein
MGRAEAEQLCGLSLGVAGDEEVSDGVVPDGAGLGDGVFAAADESLRGLGAFERVR